MNTIVTKMVWSFSLQSEYGYNIDLLLSDLKNKFELNHGEVKSLRESLKEGLNSLSDLIYSFNDVLYGHAIMNDQDVWWSIGDGKSEWYFDMPVNFETAQKEGNKVK